MKDCGPADIIRRWFETERGGSLLLPDGWYGRPFDNRHELTSLVESAGTMTLVLDKKLSLRFEGVGSVQAREGELVIGPFQRLRFDWQDFGDAEKRGAREYSSGEVRIVSS